MFYWIKVVRLIIIKIANVVVLYLFVQKPRLRNHMIGIYRIPSLLFACTNLFFNLMVRLDL